MRLLPKYRLAPTAVLLATLTLACSDDGTGPGPVDGGEVNPDLLDSGGGFGLDADGQLPQGAAVFVGPGGLLMDATAEEFIQQLTFDDGEVWQTSGFGIRAVPDESVEDAPITAMLFGVANIGSLESAPTGSYDFGAIPDPVDFTVDLPVFGYGGVQEVRGEPYTYTTDGQVVIHSVSYSNDVFQCEPRGEALIFDLCEYQVGIVRGEIEFTVPAGEGLTHEVVQQRESFTLPIRRRTILARLRDG